MEWNLQFSSKNGNWPVWSVGRRTKRKTLDPAKRRPTKWNAHLAGQTFPFMLGSFHWPMSSMEKVVRSSPKSPNQLFLIPIHLQFPYILIKNSLTDNNDSLFLSVVRNFRLLIAVKLRMFLISFLRLIAQLHSWNESNLLQGLKIAKKKRETKQKWRIKLVVFGQILRELPLGIGGFVE